MTLASSSLPDRAAPITDRAIEVLRAIVLGLDLRETASGWHFVGPFQDPKHSGVDSATMQSLLDGGLVQRGPTGAGLLTTSGENTLGESSKEALRSARISFAVGE